MLWFAIFRKTTSKGRFLEFGFLLAAAPLLLLHLGSIRPKTR